MLFHSPVFLFVFLPLVIFCYFCLRQFRPIGSGNTILLLFSYIFYLYGAAGFIVILLISTSFDYGFGLLMVRKPGQRRLWLTLSISLNVGLLAYFKYSNFLIGEVNALFTMAGYTPFDWLPVVLPIGISFFTFQKLSYIVDVYRKKVQPLTSFIDFAMYVAMFPQLVAGPIVRFGTIAGQLRSRIESWDGFYRGCLRFCWGLGKKVLVANACGRIADHIFQLGPEFVDTRLAWLGAVAYTLQIYFDFSAYSDMAIGLGALFGFKFPENFNRPYSSVSITDFWRRWHMSLSRWFRDYLYIPLGGNRYGLTRTCVNMGVVCLLCGLWHGAQWTFVIWGIYHGLFLIAERITGFREMTPDKLPLVRRGATLLVILLGWVLFRCDDMSRALDFYLAMFTITKLPVDYDLSLVLNHRDIFFTMVGAGVFFLPRDFSVFDLFFDTTPRRRLLWSALLILVVLPYCMALIVGTPMNPFIYYRF
ncbi:MAG: MBOAT family protein [Desulfobacteraceae bacterium]|nr:MBOAT family protein [Desulfobacteraceae bacterium]